MFTNYLTIRIYLIIIITAFTQLLTDLDEYTGDLTNVTLPYFDFRTYMMRTVLSGLEDTLLSSKVHTLNYCIVKLTYKLSVVSLAMSVLCLSVCLCVQLRNNQLPQLHKRLEEFHHLMMDRRFLLIVIKTMEDQRDFSIREK